MLDHLIGRRKSLHISQTELGRICGVNRRTISDVELGYRKPSFALAYKITSVLYFTPEDLGDPLLTYSHCKWISMCYLFDDRVDIAEIQLSYFFDNCE